MNRQSMGGAWATGRWTRSQLLSFIALLAYSLLAAKMLGWLMVGLVDG